VGSLASLIINQNSQRLIIRDLLQKRSVKVLFVILVALTIFRFWLGNRLGVWYIPHASLDDALFVSFADFRTHFRNDTLTSLVKTMPYGAFLRAVSLSNIPYATVITLLWILVSLLMVVLFSSVTTNPFWLAFTYLYVLFTPTAFEMLIGTRLLRNSIFPPFFYLTFALMLLLVIGVLRWPQKRGALVATAVALGVVFTFSYYLNEAGFWLTPILLLCLLACLGIHLYRCRLTSKLDDGTRQKVAWRLPAIGFLCIPLLIFGLGAVAYRTINYYFFGVWEIETRQSAELGRFVQNVYRIQSDNRTALVWAPQDAIAAAFAASPTLTSLPLATLDLIGEPQGDFLTWNLRNALWGAGVWTTNREMNELFGQVNAEIDSAFMAGILQQDDRFQLTASAGGRTTDEIIGLLPATFGTFVEYLTLSDFTPGPLHSYTWDEYSLVRAAHLTNTPLFTEAARYDELLAGSWEITSAITNGIFMFYRVINVVLALLAIIGILGALDLAWATARRIGWRATLAVGGSATTTLWLAALAIFFISIVYAFGISWFNEFIPGGNQFYALGAVPMISIVLLVGTYCVFFVLRQLRAVYQGSRLS